jgi:hypothetical protein
MRQVLTTLGTVAAAILAWIFFFLLRILWWRVRGRRPQSPESLFRVTITDDELSLQDPHGKSVAVAWKDITLVKIRTTSAGPWEPDVFWGFETRDQHPALIVVGGATGEQDMIRALNERLPGFNDDMVIKAMGSTSNREFVCWPATLQGLTAKE